MGRVDGQDGLRVALTDRVDGRVDWVHVGTLSRMVAVLAHAVAEFGSARFGFVFETENLGEFRGFSTNSRIVV